ncbi:MAG: hypothetical protein GY896_22195 [Gammaproteobacteria bacterium]|nr:hypothetical protein [Gammaproteobacteria bacterium]MCP4980177.1 hypothetical protein [Gammaproteobacteria bacterium]
MDFPIRLNTKSTIDHKYEFSNSGNLIFNISLASCATSPESYNMGFDDRTGKVIYKPAKHIYMPWEQLPTLPAEFGEIPNTPLTNMCTA